MHESDILHALCELSTTDLSDALDRLGIAGQCLGIMPFARSFRLIGRAFTIHYVPVSIERGTVGDYIDDLGLVMWWSSIMPVALMPPCGEIC